MDGGVEEPRVRDKKSRISSLTLWELRNRNIKVGFRVYGKKGCQHWVAVRSSPEETRGHDE